jgi:hypothetical protein
VRSTKSNITFPSTPFSSVLGDGGTGAIIGYDHNLIQFSSYINESFIFARGYFPGDQPEDTLRPILAQAQADNHQNYFGWGLHLQQSSRPGTKQSLRTAIERRFIYNRWPTQTDVIEGITKKAITYVDNGSLIQAVAIGSRTITSIDWTIGGLVQLGARSMRRSDINADYGTGYIVQTSPDSYILSVKCDFNYCLDIQLFNNGDRISLEPQTSEQQRGVHQDQTTDFVDIRRSGSLDLKGIFDPMIFIAVFTLRDTHASPHPTYFDCPTGDDIGELMLLPGYTRTLPPLIMNLKNEKMRSLFDMEDIITRNVAHLLYTTVLPRRPQPKACKFCPINAFVECSPVKIDYAATL